MPALAPCGGASLAARPRATVRRRTAAAPRAAAARSPAGAPVRADAYDALCRAPGPVHLTLSQAEVRVEELWDAPAGERFVLALGRSMGEFSGAARLLKTLNRAPSRPAPLRLARAG
jgi:hypothetical protein